MVASRTRHVQVSEPPASWRKRQKGATIWVIFASHNRYAQTALCIASLRRASAHAHIRMAISVFDDGSTDGTLQMLEADPEILVAKGDGTFFWARSMAQIEAVVLGSQLAEPDDLLLWINDDVEVFETAFDELVSNPPSQAEVLVGPTIGRGGGQTYGMFRRSKLNPLKVTRVPIERGPEARADAFNGNFLVVPIGVATRLGGIDGTYSHAFADLDYGYRLSAAGVQIRQTLAPVGHCELNVPNADKLLNEWKHFIGPKGAGNPKSLSHFMRSHAGRGWRILVIYTYAAWCIRAISRHAAQCLSTKRMRGRA